MGYQRVVIQSTNQGETSFVLNNLDFYYPQILYKTKSILQPLSLSSPPPLDISDFDFKTIKLKVVTDNMFKCKDE